jgi:hypothetical protein
MFEGGGFGVGLTVTDLCLDTGPRLDGERPARLGEVLPVAARTPGEKAAELQRIQAAEAALAAYKLELVAGLAADRPATYDRQPGQPGAASPDWAPGIGTPQQPGVSEFFADELAAILNFSRAEATRLAGAAGLLTGLLGATREALADGALDWPRARAIAEELLEPAAETAPEILRAVERAVLSRAGRLNVPAVRAAVQRELAARDAAASDRRRARAKKCADVTSHSRPDGMAELRIFASRPDIAALKATADTLARHAKTGGDPRPIGVLRTEAIKALVLRPWDTSRPPVTAHLTIHAPLPTVAAGAAGHDACAVNHTPGHTPATPGTPGTGSAPSTAGATRTGDAPGAGTREADPAGGPASSGAGCSGDPGVGCGAEPVPAADVDGHPITAAHLRDLLEQLDALCPGGLQAPAGGTLDIALTDPATGALRAVVSHAELQRLARRGCPTHPAGDCTCPLLDTPGPVARWRHSTAQQRLVTTRDRTCRHPGCGIRAGFADLDHVLAHAEGGSTSCDNLCCLCRRHHRLKTFAPGWTYSMTPDGTLTVTTPSGITRVTRPPGLRDPDERPDDDPAPF